MELMLSRRVESAATTDSGFRQAGFRILLAERGARNAERGTVTEAS
jgi:hypothetical protein